MSSVQQLHIKGETQPFDWECISPNWNCGCEKCEPLVVHNVSCENSCKCNCGDENCVCGCKCVVCNATDTEFQGWYEPPSGKGNNNPDGCDGEGNDSSDGDNEGDSDNAM